MSKKYYKYCIVPNCKNKSTTTSRKYFFTIPKEGTRRNLWMKISRRKCTHRVIRALVTWRGRWFIITWQSGLHFLVFSKHSSKKSSDASLGLSFLLLSSCWTSAGMQSLSLFLHWKALAFSNSREPKCMLYPHCDGGAMIIRQGNACNLLKEVSINVYQYW